MSQNRKTRRLPVVPPIHDSLPHQHGGGIANQMVHRGVNRLAPYLPPWIMGSAVITAGEVCHAVWGGSSAPWATIGLTTATGVLTLLTHAAGSVRSPIGRIHSTLSTLAAGTAITVSTIDGPFHRPLIDLLALGGVSFAASWNIRHHLRNSGLHGGEQGHADGWSQLADAARLAGSQVRQITITPNKATARLELPAGETTDQVNTTAIASALGVGAGRVRVQGDPDHAGRADLVVVPRDMLRDKIPYPGPSAPGGSLADGLSFGMFEDGVLPVMHLVADPSIGRTAGHLAVVGMSGSGKGGTARVGAAEILTRSDAVLFWVDTVKGPQTIGRRTAQVIDEHGWFVTDPQVAEDLYRGLLRVIAVQARLLAEQGLEDWTPGCGIPAIVCWTEEAPAVIRESQAYADCLARGRSVGVFMVTSMQRPSVDNWPNGDGTARSNVASVICHGIKYPRDAVMALPEDVLDAGANPAAWQANRPGYAYQVGPSIAEDRHATPSRCWDLAIPELEDTVTSYPADQRAVLHPDVVAALGSPYANRRRVIAGTVVRDEQRDPASIPAADDLPELPTPPDEDDLGDLDAEAELPAEPARLAFAAAVKASRPMGRDAALALLESAINVAEAKGETEIGPKDFHDVMVRAGRSRAWVSQELTTLAERGRLEPTDKPGRYRIHALVTV